MRTISLVTDFGFPDSTYSLNIIAEEQLGMLHRAGYEPIGIVDEGFEPQRNWTHAELRYLPHVCKSNDVEFYDGWEESVATLRTTFEEVLEGVDAWGPMALVHGRLILRDLTRMVCIDLRAQ